MQPSRTVFARMVDLFMASTTYLKVADPDQIKVQPVNITFVPGLDRVLADVPKQGSPLVSGSAVVLEDATPSVYNDPLTGDRVGVLPVDPTSPLFQGTTGTYPFTLHGVRLVSNDEATLLATQLFATPVPFSASGDGVEVPPIEFRFPTSMIR